MKSVFLITNYQPSHKTHMEQLARLRQVAPNRHYLGISSYDVPESEGLSFFKNFNLKDGIDDAELAQSLRQQFNLEPAFLYGSEPDFLYKQLPESYFLQRTAYALTTCDRLFKEFDVEVIFLGSGGSLFGNVFIELAHLRGIKAFRMFPVAYLNVVQDTERYYFCDNNYARIRPLSDSEKRTARYDLALKHAYRWMDAILNKKFLPDNEARKWAKTSGSVSFPMALELSLRIFIKSLLYRLGMRDKLANGKEKAKLLSYGRKAYLDLRRSFTKEKWRKRPYFIFVLHDPTDSQLTFRGRHFIDQMSLARIIASNLPSGTSLLVKEHPVLPGMLPIGDIRIMEKKYSNTFYLDYSYKFSDLVHDSAGVIVINSTAGLEAAIYGKPVFVFGETFYRNAPFLYNIDYIWDLTQFLSEALVNPRTATREETANLLASVYYETEPNPDTENRDLVQNITDGILKRLEPHSV